MNPDKASGDLLLGDWTRNDNGAAGCQRGAHLVGPDVSELLPELTLAQRWDLTVYELAANVHTHPTLSEALQEAIYGVAGQMINM
jgi:hypothetical protein